MSAPRGRRVVIAGASGFVGTALVRSLRERGDEVRTVGRAGDAVWGDAGGIRALVDGADVLVNLAGKSVDCRYTDANREEILRSRVETTAELGAAVSAAVRPPHVWLNASTATIYRHAMDRPQTERDGEVGTGFSVDVARAWERALFAPDLPGTRRVALRMAIVLGDGPATRMLVRLARTGLGGPQIDGWWWPHRRYRGIGAHATGGVRPPVRRTRGRQMFSWIHLEDALAAIEFAIRTEGLSGPVNLASPHPVDNRTLMRTLRSAVGMPVGLPAYRWMLEPAMWVLRTEPELVLKSRWVVPEVLTSSGFTFRRPLLQDAVADIVGGRGRPAS